jgi:hypothetical protein
MPGRSSAGTAPCRKAPGHRARFDTGGGRPSCAHGDFEPQPFPVDPPTVLDHRHRLAIDRPNPRHALRGRGFPAINHINRLPGPSELQSSLMRLPCDCRVLAGRPRHRVRLSQPHGPTASPFAQFALNSTIMRPASRNRHYFDHSAVDLSTDSVATTSRPIQPQTG